MTHDQEQKHTDTCSAGAARALSTLGNERENRPWSSVHKKTLIACYLLNLFQLIETLVLENPNRHRYLYPNHSLCPIYDKFKVVLYYLQLGTFKELSSILKVVKPKTLILVLCKCIYQVRNNFWFCKVLVNLFSVILKYWLPRSGNGKVLILCSIYAAVCLFCVFLIVFYCCVRWSTFKFNHEIFYYLYDVCAKTAGLLILIYITVINRIYYARSRLLLITIVCNVSYQRISNVTRIWSVKLLFYKNDFLQ